MTLLRWICMMGTERRHYTLAFGQMKHDTLAMYDHDDHEIPIENCP